MQTSILKNKKINMAPIKKALYFIQVVIISISIPVLCVVEISHNSKESKSVDISANHNQKPVKATVNI